MANNGGSGIMADSSRVILNGGKNLINLPRAPGNVGISPAFGRRRRRSGVDDAVAATVEAGKFTGPTSRKAQSISLYVHGAGAAQWTALRRQQK